MRRTVDHVKAVDEVSVSIRATDRGVVGESGSGKPLWGWHFCDFCE
jgi:ABC-type oligopeptide transport system ATPase subunit